MFDQRDLYFVGLIAVGGFCLFCGLALLGCWR